jgi:predicted AAA+ superfamily ATPase
MTAKEMYAELKDRLSPSGKTYFFLDEVQEIKGWEKVVNVEILLCAGFQLKVGNYLSCGE